MKFVKHFSKMSKLSDTKETFLKLCGYKITQISSFLKSIMTLTAKQALNGHEKIQEYINDVLLEIPDNDDEYLNYLRMTIIKWNKYLKRVIYIADSKYHVIF